MGKTVLFVNEKGGVGKSTAAWTMGHVLSEGGSRVLLVDADKQRTLSLLPYDPAGSGYKLGDVPGPTLFDVARGAAGPAEAVRATRFEGLDIICADPRMEELGSGELAAALDAAIALGEGSYDYTLVDFRRDFGSVLVRMEPRAEGAMLAVIPVRSDDAFEEGIAKVVGDLGGLCGFRVLFTQVYRSGDRVSVLDAAAMEILDGIEGVDRFEASIRFSPRVGESTFYGRPVTDKFPGHRASDDYRAATAELAGLLRG